MQPTPVPPNPARAPRESHPVFDWLCQTLGGWRYPFFLIWLIVGFTAFVTVLLFTPEAPTGFGAFAAEFRVWCFGYDEATGQVEWAYVVMLVVQPLILAAMIAGLWWSPLKDAFAEAPKRMVPVAVSALTVAAMIGAGLMTMEPGSAEAATPADDLVFQPDVLRTAHPAPDFALTDQTGATVDVAALKGKVVLLTGVYASCGLTCPMIMAQSKAAVATLTDRQRADLRIVAVTLDPQRDTPQVLAAMAEAQGIQAPTYRLVTGPQAVVSKALDQIGVRRNRDPETGIIDHTNIFVLVDRSGVVAFRFSLGERQQAWMSEALQLLLNEGSAGRP